MRVKIEPGPDADLETLERHGSDELQAVVAARPELLQDAAFRDVLARARSFVPRGTNFARSALRTFRMADLRTFA